MRRQPGRGLPLRHVYKALRRVLCLPCDARGAHSGLPARFRNLRGRRVYLVSRLPSGLALRRGDLLRLPRGGRWSVWAQRGLPGLNAKPCVSGFLRPLHTCRFSLRTITAACRYGGTSSKSRFELATNTAITARIASYSKSTRGSRSDSQPFANPFSDVLDDSQLSPKDSTDRGANSWLSDFGHSGRRRR